MAGKMRQRGKHGGKSFDMQALRALVEKCIPLTTVFGIVRLFPGETSHFEIVTSDDDPTFREIMVDVELIPRSEKVLCRLGFGNDQVYKIPRVNQEVAVMIPQNRDSLIRDELDADGIIVAVMDTFAPAELDDDDVVIVKAPRVIVLADLIQLGENAEPLATKADVQAVRDDLHQHTHLYVPYPGGVAGTAVPTTGNPSVTAPVGTNIVTGD